VSRDSAGRFFISFTADGAPLKPKAEIVGPLPAVGVDRGVKDLLVDSAGARVPVSRALRERQQRLRRYQRSQARRLRVAMLQAGLDPAKSIPKGARLSKSRRFRRARLRIARLHARIGDARRELLHQSSAALVQRHGLIGLEDLAVKGMQRGLPRLRRRIGNAGMGELRRQLEYKARWRGRQLVPVDRFFPSSQLCSVCGLRHAELTLNERHWQCPACGARHDRDVNAAKNIRAEALRIAAAEAYREELGKLRAGSEPDSAEGLPLPAGLDTSNRELTVSPPVRARRRRARGDRAMAEVA
jgi:putative transposase